MCSLEVGDALALIDQSLCDGPNVARLEIVAPASEGWSAKCAIRAHAVTGTGIGANSKHRTNPPAAYRVLVSFAYATRR